MLVSPAEEEDGVDPPSDFAVLHEGVTAIVAVFVIALVEALVAVSSPNAGE